MLRSMTAFGRAEYSGQAENILAEIHSVNSRRLEIIVNIPSELTEFDPRLRKLIASAVSRGRLSLFISVQPACDRGFALQVNLDLARQLKRAYDELREELGYSEEVPLSLLVARPDIISLRNAALDAEERWEGVKAATERAIDRLIVMKDAEGQNLRPYFENHLATLGSLVTSIEERTPESLQKHEAKLTARVEEAFSGLHDNEDRLLREIAILADRLDISEELSRLRSHIGQLHTAMNDTEPSGRTMHFLLQEMHREINTIGAKATDLATSQLVVQAKTELEKLREQTQNVE